ncbi:MAG: hypothetical protein AAGC81_13955 [Pseudomonadota bacterium]
MRYMLLVTAIMMLPATALGQDEEKPAEAPLVFEIDLTGPDDKRRTFRCDDARVIKDPAPIFSQQTDALAIHQNQRRRHIADINRQTLRGCE